MSQPEERTELVERALAFARDSLGPASEAAMARPAMQALMLSRVRGGADPEDAVLGVIHGAMADDRQLQNEFVAHFLTDVLRAGKPMLSPRLRSFLDTCDLAQSVFGDLWPQLADVRFETRAQFLSLMRQRLSWKASNRARALPPSAAAAEPHEPADDAPSPERALDLREEHELMILALVRLAPRDRELLEAHLRGEDGAAIAKRFSLSLAAAKKALTRAKRRARHLLARDRSSLSASSSSRIS
jgi:RNA polymerase sigma factor (sigma-70 family)